MKYTPVYHKTMDAICRTGRYVSSRGGTRSGKTFANLQAIFELAAQDTTATITSVVSETFPHLKRGAIRDFASALGDYFDPACWNKSESIYTLPHNGATIEFFSADSPSKVHGPARDRLFINEIQNIPYEIARQLFIRTRGLIILDYNPTAQFWGNEITEAREDCITVVSTYLDNSFLTQEQVAEIESNRGNSNWWKVYGLGEFGELDGVIYQFDTIDEMPDDGKLVEIWGMDFGFTHDPTAIVRVLADTGRRIAYVDERCYRTGMLNRDISDVLRGEGIRRGTHIWADAAEPKSIAEIGRDTGLNVLASNKSAPSNKDRLVFQLQWMQGWQVRVTKRSVNLIKELRNYTWAKDRDGNLLNQPIDIWNHCFVGETRITTATGDKPIRRVKPGDMVLTSEGYRKVINKWDNGLKEVLFLSIKFVNFEVVIKATPDHKIKTTQGWKQLKDIQAGDEIYLHRSSMEKCIAYTLGSDTIQEGTIDCTASFGNTITARSRRIARYITRTATRITTTFQTWLASLTASTRPNTEKKASPVESPKKGLQIFTRLLRPRRNGTEAMPDTTGTPAMPANNGKGRKNGRRSANVAGRCSDTGRYKPLASAQTPASQNGVGMQDLTTKPEPASFAGKSSEQTAIPTLAPARVLAVRNVAGRFATKKRRVYDLTVEGCHEYFANGILVHNCLDAFRYALFSELAGRFRPYGAGRRGVRVH